MNKSRSKGGSREKGSAADAAETGRGFNVSSPRFMIAVGVLLTTAATLYLVWFTHMFDRHNEVNIPQANTKNIIKPRQDSRLPAITPEEPRQDSNNRAPPDFVEIVTGEKPVRTIPPDYHPKELKVPEVHPESEKIEVKPQPKAPQDSHPQSPQSARYVHSTDLPGANKHPILRMPIETLLDTSVDQLMAPYGEAEGGPQCGDDYGNSLIRRWRETRKPNCIPPTSPDSSSPNAAHPQNSVIDCFLMHQNHHHGNGDNLCLMQNVALDLGLLGKDSFTHPVIDHYVNTRHGDQPYPKYPRGFLVGDCAVNQEHWQGRVMPGWNVDLTVNAFRPLSDFPSANSVHCDEWIEHPVLLQERDTFANFFHDSEDFVNVFLAMAVLQWKPRDMQVYLMDLYPKGPFWEMWGEVFSHDNPTYTAWDLKQHFGRKDDRSKYICFKNVAMGIYGPAAPTTICSWDHPCHHTALVRAYSDFVIRGLDLQHLTHYAQSQPSKEVVVTYMARKPTKEWPEKKYCDSENSFFRCELWRNFGSRSLGRMIRNDDALVAGLKRLETETFANGAKVKIQAVDFNVLSLKEQIAVDLQTDIMVGPHGAGLMHNIFMRDRASLIELFVDGSSANRHFHNLAGWYGRRYEGVGMNNPVNVDQVVQLVRKHVRDMDMLSY